MHITKITKRPTNSRVQKATRIYIWPAKGAVLENIFGRCSSPHKLYRRDVIPQVLAALGLPADTKLRWSQYAGCSCPCSPGFIIDASSMQVLDDHNRLCDVSVEVVGEPKAEN